MPTAGHSTTARKTEAMSPALWHEPAPFHFDLRAVWWVKALAITLCTVLAILFFDQPIAAYAKAHPIPDLFNAAAPHGDAGRELMFMEQWGQGVCSVLVIAAVFLIDPAGRR